VKRGIDIPKFPNEVPSTDRLKGLSLAIHTLNHLNDNQHFDIKKIANEFDHNEKFVLSVIEFLKDIKWLIQDENGKYSITEQAKLEISYLNDRQHYHN
jgi:predicted transcriptional regulator